MLTVYVAHWWLALFAVIVVTLLALGAQILWG
jgi:predicted secreted protein